MSKKALDSIYDLREDEVMIEGKAWDDEIVQRLAHKQIIHFEKCIDYWKYLLDRGRDYFDKYTGKILSDEQIEVYEKVEDKIVIQPPIMKSPIRALLGQTIKGRKSGQITAEGGTLDEPAASVDEVATINMCLKDMELKTEEKYRSRDAIHDSYVACYTNVLYFEKKKPTFDNPLRIKLKHLQWDSCVFEPLTYQETNGSDISGMFYFDFYSQAQLEEEFPEMKKNIRAHWDKSDTVDAQMMSSLQQWDGDDSSEYRDTLRNVIERTRGSMTGPSGLIPVVCHLYPIKKKEDVWVNIFDDDDYKVRPSDWDDDKWDKWVEQNKEVYQGPYEREATVLWCTVFTTSGLVLSNGKHWFQECGTLPASFWTPCMISGMPSGPAADMVEDVLRNCVAQIEWLDDVRKGHGILALFREGAIKNMDEITEEANKAFGVGIVSKDFNGPLSNAVHEIKRDPTDTWKQYADQTRGDMYENTRLNETMQGGAAPRQAAIAKELEIAQALTVNAIYIDNHNRSWEYHQNLKLALLPYAYDEWQTIDVFDEEEQETKVQDINVPVYDMEGNKIDVLNDVNKRRYRWKLSPNDDSPTSKARHVEEALILINGAAGPLLGKDPSGKLFARFLMAFPNEFLNKAGKAMAEDAQMVMQQQSEAEKQKALSESQIEFAKAQAELIKAQKSGTNISFTGQQLAEYPNLLGVYQQLQAMFGAQAQSAMQMPQTAQQPAQQPVAV
jgi:hypothetical protein